ncbi:hypothetical protein [Streptomyces sp. NPDC058548]|uniref:hypothetical protein n=1 Tax=unclassified Streptomyces TaxID=2593676 RepID=UPI003654A11A
MARAVNPAAAVACAAVVVAVAGGLSPAVAAPVALAHAGAPVAAPADGGQKVKYYVVTKQANGQPEFLFSIAEKVLGDGNRFNEIFELNKGRKQADGSVVKNATSIAPGWVLQLPPDANGPGVQEGPLPKGAGEPVPVTAPPGTQVPVQEPGTQTQAPAAAPAPVGGSSGALSLALGSGFALVVGAAAGTLVLRRRSANRRAAARPVASEPEPALAEIVHPFAAPARPSSPFDTPVRPATTATPAGLRTRAPRSVAPRTASPAPVPDPVTEQDGAASIAPVPTPIQRTAVSVSAAATASGGPRSTGDRTGSRRSRPIAPGWGADEDDDEGHEAEVPPSSGARRGRSRGASSSFQVTFGDDLVDIVLSGTHPAHQDTSVAWMPVPYETPEGGAAFVCIGSADPSGCLFLDLAQAPGALSFGGDREAARRLMESVVLQLSASAVLDHSCATVVGPLRGLADGLERVEKIGSLRELVERRAEETDPPFEFVFCALASDDDRAALGDLVDGPGRVVPVVLGEAEDVAWTLRVTPGEAAD